MRIYGWALLGKSATDAPVLVVPEGHLWTQEHAERARRVLLNHGAIVSVVPVVRLSDVAPESIIETRIRLVV